MSIIVPPTADLEAGSVKSPGRPPRTTCHHRGPRYACNRPEGHTGRHSFRWYHLGGVIRGVWGER